MTLKVRPEQPADHEWKLRVLRDEWGSVRMARRGERKDLSRSPSFIAELDGEPMGLATYDIEGEECELSSLVSLREGAGCGSALTAAVEAAARQAGCKRVWLITTNDNTHALRFYQRRGYVLTALYPDSIRRARLLKPEIPSRGQDGIPIRDEIELAKVL